MFQIKSFLSRERLVCLAVLAMALLSFPWYIQSQFGRSMSWDSYKDLVLMGYTLLIPAVVVILSSRPKASLAGIVSVAIFLPWFFFEVDVAPAAGGVSFILFPFIALGVLACLVGVLVGWLACGRSSSRR